ncbi:hypothetical protein ZOSMA_185G00530 [Zostera marina]|uniref:Uncharacterized protein n=1 Tax=Zostera marina TaxID=29655 RepID=A0A0K9PQK9_ZOSMR|nr:hypothetical protein ZOSMA_185G00530 [Zostera marina]
MEASMNLRFFTLAAMAIIFAFSIVEKVSAVDAPAPSPDSGAFSLSTPIAAVVSITVVAFSFLFC